MSFQADADMYSYYDGSDYYVDLSQNGESRPYLSHGSNDKENSSTAYAKISTNPWTHPILGDMDNETGHLLNPYLYSDGYYYYDDQQLTSYAAKSVHFVEPIVLVVLSLLALLSNGLFICATFHLARRHRTMTYLFLGNVAVVHVLYVLSSGPLSAVTYYLNDWPFGGTTCKLSGYVTSVLTSVGVLTLVTAGVDNSMALLSTDSSSYSAFRTRQKAMATIAALWVISLVLTTPRLFLFDVLELFGSEGVYSLCSRLPAGQRARQVDSATLLVVGYLLPLSVLAFCLVRVARKQVCRKREACGRRRKMRRMGRVLWGVAWLCAVGWLPLHVVHMYEDFAGQGDSILFPHRAMLVLGLSMGTSALYPWVCCALNKRLMQRTRSVLACRKPWDQDTSQSTVPRALSTAVTPGELHLRLLQLESERVGGGGEEGRQLGLSAERGSVPRTETVGQ